MTPRVCNYFITLRCNDTCEFCPIWPKQEEHSKIEEKPYDLSLLKQAGIRKLNIIGGEPLLRDDLPDILKKAKELGLEVELTTNGILYADRGKALAGLVARLYISLDYPIPAEHDRSRGVDCFHAAIAALEYARGLGEKPVINFTLTRDSVRFLPEMVELAVKFRVPVQLSPVSDFFGTQGFAPETINYLRYYARRKNVFLNYAVLELVRGGGNNLLLPRCRAQETTVTLMPDGSRLAPCFFNPQGKQGKAAVCSSCMRWPYMLPSFSIGIDKYFWLNLYSEWIKRRKLT